MSAITKAHHLPIPPCNIWPNLQKGEVQSTVGVTPFREFIQQAKEVYHDSEYIAGIMESVKQNRRNEVQI